MFFRESMVLLFIFPLRYIGRENNRVGYICLHHLEFRDTPWCDQRGSNACSGISKVNKEGLSKDRDLDWIWKRRTVTACDLNLFAR